MCSEFVSHLCTIQVFNAHSFYSTVSDIFKFGFRKIKDVKHSTGARQFKPKCIFCAIEMFDPFVTCRSSVEAGVQYC